MQKELSQPTNFWGLCGSETRKNFEVTLVSFLLCVDFCIVLDIIGLGNRRKELFENEQIPK
jgi:hypothetical protein